MDLTSLSTGAVDPLRRWLDIRTGRRAYTMQLIGLLGVLALIDVSLTWLGLRLALEVRISSGLLKYLGPYDPALYARAILIAVPLWMLMFVLVGMYRMDNLLGGFAEYRAAVKACAAGALILAVASFLRRDDDELSRGWLLLAWVFTTALIIGARFSVRRIAYALRRRGYLSARVLIVGANDQGVAIARQWRTAPTSGMHVVGFLDDFKPAGTPVDDGMAVLGPATALADIARQQAVDEVVLVQNGVAWETFQEILARPQINAPYHLRLSPGYYDVMSNSFSVTTKNFVPLFTINDSRIVGIDAILKFAIDYLLSLFALVLVAPLMAAIGLWLWLARATRGGPPVLERFRVYGQNDRAFVMHKFRVTPGAGQARSVRIGGRLWLEGVLDRAGLDKLPQLLNVIGGDMALVGTRPRLVELAGETAPEMRPPILRTVRPGVVGYYSFIPSGAPEELERDLYYVRNWTVWLDLQIVFMSLAAVLGLRELRRGT